MDKLIEIVANLILEISVLKENNNVIKTNFNTLVNFLANKGFELNALSFFDSKNINGLENMPRILVSREMVGQEFKSSQEKTAGKGTEGNEFPLPVFKEKNLRKAIKKTENGEEVPVLEVVSKIFFLNLRSSRLFCWII